MSDPTAAVGGQFVSAAAWLTALRALGYRAEFRPGETASLLGGDLEFRLGHPTVAADQDIHLFVNVEFFNLPRHVPTQVLHHRAARLERLRALKAPSIAVLQEGLNVGWVTAGRSGVIAFLEKHLADQKAAGQTIEDLAEERALLKSWREKRRTLSQCVLFSGQTRSELGLFAEYLLAASYAKAAGGRLQYVTGNGVVSVSGADATGLSALLEAWGDYQQTWRLLADGKPSEEPLFTGWSEPEADGD